MTKRPTRPAPLRADEMACLHALRSRKDRVTAIALAAQLPIKETTKVLNALSEKGLIRRGPNSRNWEMTKRGQTWAQRKSGQSGGERQLKKVGPAGERLLSILDHPMRGDELARRLNVTRQRVHQLMVKLMALGRLRVGDPDRATLIVARHDDRSVLLSYKAERVLSSLPRTDETIASYVATGLEIPLINVLEQLPWLADQGLIGETGRFSKGPHYALTEAGASHPQYRPDATKAQPAPLPVRSNRVCQVLSHLVDHGPVRIRDLRDTLQIEHTSMNALAQYLKRKGLIRKTDGSLHAPVELTTQGLDTQRAMVRRNAQEHA
jgi:DNA-binding MarR family transcriptional regulator